ncbi:MAG: hypothetical protein K0B11_10945 [Mariniphaga sp.]|nr:hypothetical protein [Mariniphaga sp.]
MKKTILGVLLIACWFSALSKPIQSKVECTEKSSELQELLKSADKEKEKAFLNNLTGLCGKSFRGKETYTAPGRDSWADKDFVMHVTVCEEDKVYIPFHLGEDHSRTWMFIMEGQRLRFRHDHRHEDGTPEELTMYGGYSDGTGTGYKQKFPADDYTIKLLDDNASREWRVILAEDISTFTYQLLYNGEVVFSAEFDLTRPI